MPIYSKFSCEYYVSSNVNDRFKVTQIDGATTSNIALTSGRYRDMCQLATEIDDRLTEKFGSWNVTISNSGYMSFSCSENFAIDWNTSEYGTTLRDDLGYSGVEVVV